MAMWGGGGAAGWSTNLGGGRGGMGGGTGRGGDGWDDDYLGKIYDAAVVRRFGPYLRPYRAQVAFAFLGMVLQSIANYSQPFLLALTVKAGVEGNERGVLMLLGLLLGISGVGWASLYLQQVLINQVGNRILVQ